MQSGSRDLELITAAAPDAGFRIEGLRLAREPHRYSGRTSMRANQSVSEPRVPQDPDTALAFSMEGYSGFRHPRQQVPFAWAPGWNSPQAWNKFTDEVGGHLRGGDPGIRLREPQPGYYHYEADIPAAYEPLERVFRPWFCHACSVARKPRPWRSHSPADGATGTAAFGNRCNSPGGRAGRTGHSQGRAGCVTLPARVQVDWPQGLVGLPAGCVPAGIADGPVTLTAGPGSTPGAVCEVRP